MNWLISGLRRWIAAAVPVFLILSGVRVVMTEAFVRFEYQRAGFPADRFGFTQQERLDYAPYTVRYLHNSADISYLGDLTFEDGTPLFEARELRHMEDVKTVARVALKVHTIVTLGLAAALVFLIGRRERHATLRQGLAQGAVTTIAAIILMVGLVFASWDIAFESFHRVFFAGDSWQFSTSDTLIRLFPERFWFDAALTIGGIALGGALLLLISMAYWGRRDAARAHSSDSVSS
jgi:integral membrane protein (TIGR01906 family)